MARISAVVAAFPGTVTGFVLGDLGKFAESGSAVAGWASEVL